MSKNFENEKSMLRFHIIAAIMTILVIGVLAKGFYIMTVERSYWNAVAAKIKILDKEVPATRGSILSCNGQRMACNLPEYRLYMDFKSLKNGKADTLWHDTKGRDTKELNQLCEGLHKIFPEKSAAEFKEHLKEGYNKTSQYWPVLKRRVTYSEYNEAKSLPIFRLKPGLGGFAPQQFMVRNRPYGSMASAIIGGLYKEKDQAYSGIELAYDSILRGKPGFKHRRKVLNGYVDIIDSAAVDGCDVVSTIDVSIQDLAERSLKKELIKDNAYTGVAIVMEVATGDIKAMVNLDLDRETGKYYEGANHAISDWLEPGSVFKTASFMVALEDGVIDTTTMVDTGCGIREMYGAKMRDHNWHRGGYGVISVPRVLQVSSNIGVSYLIDKYYHNNPEKFVTGLHRVGIAEDLKLPLKGYMAPRVRMPKKNKHGQWVNWSNTALPWMSIGYETNVPPISVVTFYNAIANGGVMVRPRFVKRVEKQGEVVEEFPVDVIKKQICSPTTLSKIQTILHQVVSIGLGKTAGSKHFSVSGKTGTAQKASGGGYKNGTVNYLLSFCGYFPSEKPRYSCIVCIHKAGLPASGGLMSGQVFHDIAEGIMAQNIKYDVKSSRDSLSVLVPTVKSGNMASADYVLSRLNIPTVGGWHGANAVGTPVWGNAESTHKEVMIRKNPVTPKNTMPDVHGMGARDAVYMVESRGAVVTIHGKGKVTAQSKAPGTKIKKGEKVTLTLN